MKTECKLHSPLPGDLVQNDSGKHETLVEKMPIKKSEKYRK